MNFFGKNESLTKSIKNFDNFEKTAWNYYLQYGIKDRKNKEIVNEIGNLPVLKSVHYRDRWDVFVYYMIEMSQCEYSGNLLVVPANQYVKIQEHHKTMCCGIFYGEFTSLYDKSRKYAILFDYGH